MESTFCGSSSGVRAFVANEQAAGSNPVYHSMNPTIIGNRTEGEVLAALMRNGFSVLLPFGGGLRYDLVYDNGADLIRVQCKTARYKNGSVEFRASSVESATKHTNYTDQIDEFGIYCSQLNTVYLVPITHITGWSTQHLRVEPTKNNQSEGIRWAKQYEI